MIESAVLHCIPNLGNGGAERQLRMLAPALVAAGIRTGIAARLTDADAVWLEDAGIHPIPLQSPGSFNPGLVVEVALAARRLGVGVIQTWLPQMDVIGGVAALVLGLPTILSERSSIMAYGSGVRDRGRRLFGRRADVVVANSSGGCAVWAGHPHCVVIPNAIQTPGPDHRPRVAEWDVVCASRLSDEKNIGLVIQACAILQRSGHAVRLAIAGDGPDRQKLETLAAETLHSGIVTFVGHRTEIQDFFRRARFFVSASRFEGHPNAVLEAAGMGTAVILSDIPGHRDAFGEAALYFSPDSPGSLARAIAEAFANPDETERRRAAALRIVESLSLNSAVERYVGIYRKVIGDRS